MKPPSIGSTVALGRFNPDGPTGYVAVNRDGQQTGPPRDTRKQAEHDTEPRNQTPVAGLTTSLEDTP